MKDGEVDERRAQLQRAESLANFQHGSQSNILKEW